MLPRLPPIPAWHRRLPTRAAPLALFERLYAGETYAFLYESLEAHGQRGRYSFLGARPRAVFRASGRALELEERAPAIDPARPEAGRVHRAEGDPFEALRRLVPIQEDAPPVAPFNGGAVGYFAYDSVRQIERLPAGKPDDLGLPDAVFLFPREVICFDHLDGLVHLILYQEAGHAERLAEIQRALAACGVDERRHAPLSTRVQRDAAPAPPADAEAARRPPLPSNMTRGQFEAMVVRAKEYINAGDIFQVVLSQRFEFAPTAPPLSLYRALRETNPSPYMYCLRLGETHIVGSSPETLVRLSGRRAVVRPIAGTRRRGRTPEEDLALARELQNDPKERAEHVMLVDLGRNDLGRVCEFGSVQTRDVLSTEYHSRVMHLVSSVEGWLREDCDAIDLFKATFPAGTVSGAPKIRAMEIIDELEPVKRGVYAGALGYISVLGDLDMCITIRTIVLHGGCGFIQAGAGIVADSSPELEYKETLNKAAALARAVERATEAYRGTSSE